LDCPKASDTYAGRKEKHMACFAALSLSLCRKKLYVSIEFGYDLREWLASQLQINLTKKITLNTFARTRFAL
jgi:hypothetical protein